jgi:hypothetical protein
MELVQLTRAASPPGPDDFSGQHTRFRKSVREAPEAPGASGLRVLKPGTSNKKLGWMVTKGPFRGMPIHSLTLEERATCWAGCQNLDRCYGNNMYLAHRYAPGPALETALEADLRDLAARFPRGFVVRLHILGDFYSVDYVQFWDRMVREIPELHIFGFTHWRQASAIGAEVARFAGAHGARVSMLRSDPTEADDPMKAAYTVDWVPGVPHAELAHEGSVSCPHEEGKVRDCASCGLCMSNHRINLSWVDHSDKVIRAKTRATRSAA